MFDQNQKAMALLFARALSARDYDAAHAMLSSRLKSYLSINLMQKQFETMIPLDWGIVDPIDLLDNDEYPFLYVGLGGDVYSEAIIINEFVFEDGAVKINDFELGRP